MNDEDIAPPDHDEWMVHFEHALKTHPTLSALAGKLVPAPIDADLAAELRKALGEHGVEASDDELADFMSAIGDMDSDDDEDDESVPYGDWDEKKHKRAADGKFGSGGGSSKKEDDKEEGKEPEKPAASAPKDAPAKPPEPKPEPPPAPKKPWHERLTGNPIMNRIAVAGVPALAAVAAVLLARRGGGESTEKGESVPTPKKEYTPSRKRDGVISIDEVKLGPKEEAASRREGEKMQADWQKTLARIKANMAVHRGIDTID